jgi:threonine/homoserine/homoserine lactone efflux protein
MILDSHFATSSDTLAEEEDAMDAYDRLFKKAWKPATCTATGAAVGVGVHSTIGGVGVAATGTAFGMTLIPLMLTGATVALTAYGIYSLGKKRGNQKNDN